MNKLVMWCYAAMVALGLMLVWSNPGWSKDCGPNAQAVEEMKAEAAEAEMKIASLDGENAKRFQQELDERLGPVPERYQGADTFYFGFPVEGPEIVVGFAKEGCIFAVQPGWPLKSVLELVQKALLPKGTPL